MSEAAGIARAAAFALLLLAFPENPAWGWGARTHEIINGRAVELLPPRAREAWDPFAGALAEHANDADHRKRSSRDEPGRHFIDIDFYGTYPFERVPRDRKVLEERKGTETVQRWGVVPWAIAECYDGLVEALRAGDWTSAVTWAADLGHYTADSHQPLHCTKNYDGQNTGNDGVHFRFEVMMMDRFFQESMLEDEAILPAMDRSPADMCFDWIPQAYSGIEPILIADREARALDPHFEDRYYEHLWRGTESVAVRQVRAATIAFAVLLQGAWAEAGSPIPPPSPTQATPFEEPVPLEKPSRTAGALPAIGIAVGLMLAAFLAGRS